MCKKSLKKYDQLNQTTSKIMFCFMFRFLKEMICFCFYTCYPLVKLSEFFGVRQGLSVNINLLSDTALKEVFKSEHLLCK